MRRLCLIGSAGAAACYAALAFVPLWWLDALAMFVAGLAFYMLHNSMQTEATELAPSARGSAVALFACGFFVGQGLGPLVFGGLLHALGPRPALLAGRDDDRRPRPDRGRAGDRPAARSGGADRLSRPAQPGSCGTRSSWAVS